MVRALEVSQPLVAPVGGQGVLDQVVRADGEERDLGGDIPGPDRGRWGLDHHPDLDLPERLPLVL